MKLKLSIFLLSLFTIFINGQSDNDPTFDQTSEYIIKNTKGRVMYPGDLDAYSRVKGYHLKDIKIDKSGKIEMLTDQKFDDNQFSIIFNVFDLVEKVDYPDGIRAYKYLVHFNGLNVSNGYGIAFATDADAQKVARAFRHLKKVSTKPDDLFSQVPQEEKKVKLSREETLDYINNMIYNNGDYIASATFSSKDAWENISTYANGKFYYDSNSKKYSFSSTRKTLEYYGADLTEGDPDVTNYTGLNFKYYSSLNKGDVGLTYYGGQIIPILTILILEENKHYQPIPIFLPWNSSGRKNDHRKFEDFETIYGKEIQRLKKAFERLKELDSDEKDPFDD